MKTVKAHIESLFEAIARFLFHHRLKTLLIIALFFAATVSQLPDISMDTSTEGFLHENDPALQAYNDFRDHLASFLEHLSAQKQLHMGGLSPAS